MTYVRKDTKEQLIALARERGLYPPENATDEELNRVERRLSAERGWIVEPQPASHGVEKWVAHHRGQGHHPHPAPTKKNPERWDCECGYIWRILTGEQIRMKFAHLGAAAKARREGRPVPRRVICSLTLTEHCPYEGEEDKGSE